MSYSVKEIYYTLQGEGFHAGRPAVFCRFSGCNLWNGKESDKAESSCWFCDTDFVGIDGPNGGKFSKAELLREAIAALWPSSKQHPFVVFTGGEPLLQLDSQLIATCKNAGFEIAVETNGTVLAPEGIDWLTVSPKPKSELVQKVGAELKLAFPHDVSPDSLQGLNFEHYYLSPINTDCAERNAKHLERAINYCRENPNWKLTQQFHKIWNLP